AAEATASRQRARPTRTAVERKARAARATSVVFVNPMEREMNDTGLDPFANLTSSLGLDREDLEGLEADGGALGQVGVAEQLLIAWRHIIGGPNATVDVGLGLLHVSLNASTPANLPGNLSANLTGNASATQLLGLGGYMELGNASTWTEHEELVHLVQMVSVAVLLGLVILTTVIGNVFVIAAILLERHLQNVANYLILSLAVADLLVACLVMPLGAVYEVSQQWTLGPELCDMWTSSDVLCCTASILHLVAI
ncbi:hypothetical protein FOCC_FOCC012079, partial [Frankliniella occidentalis]